MVFFNHLTTEVRKQSLKKITSQWSIINFSFGTSSLKEILMNPGGKKCSNIPVIPSDCRNGLLAVTALHLKEALAC